MKSSGPSNFCYSKTKLKYNHTHSKNPLEMYSLKAVAGGRTGLGKECSQIVFPELSAKL